ncbi:GNAT family N-acetyltransferase [Longispora sp. NPDC051575]|uniref:GNAT family N-acetyltransferase n=1 Tax=Longispora sp. NPDC051575 TaxID=3154943 RepID=UPI003429FD2D
MAHTLRQATESDLDALVAYEIVIAEVSFGADAVVDPEVHRGKLRKGLTRDAEGMVVAVDGADQVIGWMWLAVNTNFLTEDRYINFRSLAVSPGPDSEAVGESLLAHGLEFAKAKGAGEIVGKVYMGNQGMRVLYRKFDFEPVHLTLRRKIEP